MRTLLYTVLFNLENTVLNAIPVGANRVFALATNAGFQHSRLETLFSTVLFSLEKVLRVTPSPAL